MLNIKKILFPTDFSACAERAFSHAAYLADRHDAEIHVLHVVETADLPKSLLVDLIITEEDIAEQIRAAAAESTETSLETGMRIVHVQRRGPSAAGAILHYAEQEDIDLIVMGTHGRRGIDRMMAGSVAEEVMRLAGCPVFTVRDRRKPVSLESMRGLLVPIDFSGYSRSALRYARQLADAYGARIDLLHVIEEPALPGLYGIVAPPLDTAAVQARAQQALNEVASEAGLKRFRTAVVAGHAPAEVLDYAEVHDIDLMVIATHGRTGLARFLMGSVAESVTRMAPCPVFVVKSFGRDLLTPKHAAALAATKKQPVEA